MLIFIIAIAGIWARINAYGDFRLSVGMSDTPSYINASRANLFSPQIFTGGRLFTTNLLYKVANDSHQCPLTVLSNPSLGVELSREIQPCFDKIALLQNGLSIVGWLFLALVVARWLQNFFYKALAVLLILTFGYVPQIAEWASVLSTESISLSLFAIVAGLTLEISQRTADQKQKSAGTTRVLIVIWLVVIILWVFLRDVHLYACLTTTALLLPLLALKKIRPSTGISTAVYILLGVFILGIYTTQKSPRWELPLFHVMDGRVFTDQGMVNYFASHFDMPRDPASSEYEEWFATSGYRSYGIFLATHPGYVVSSLMERADYLADGYLQPYFTTSEIENRKALLTIGQLVHPETNAVYLLDAVLVVSIIVISLRHPSSHQWAWSWFIAWVFFYASASLLLSFFGDNIGIHRHIFPSVAIFRLLLWIGLLANVDSLAQESNFVGLTANKNQISTQAKES